jgi:lysozyme
MIKFAESSTFSQSPSKSNRQATIYRWLGMLLIFGLLLASLAPASTAYAEDGVHVVQRGESLGTIAQRYNVSLSELARNNGISNPNFIYVGQRLVIPGTQASSSRGVTSASTLVGDGYYTVQRGNTLAQIALNHGMTINDLLRLNGLTNPNFIWVGQKLRVSARAQALTIDEKVAKPAVADSIYVVRPGDTLSEIAQSHSTTVQALLVANGLPNANFCVDGSAPARQQSSARHGNAGYQCPGGWGALDRSQSIRADADSLAGECACPAYVC